MNLGAFWTWRQRMATLALVLVEAAVVGSLVLAVVEGRYGLAALLLVALLLLWIFAVIPLGLFGVVRLHWVSHLLLLVAGTLAAAHGWLALFARRAK